VKILVGKFGKAECATIIITIRIHSAFLGINFAIRVMSYGYFALVHFGLILASPYIAVFVFSALVSTRNRKIAEFREQD
jgi:hypothetical protein